MDGVGRAELVVELLGEPPAIDGLATRPRRADAKQRRHIPAAPTEEILVLLVCERAVSATAANRARTRTTAHAHDQRHAVPRGSTVSAVPRVPKERRLMKASPAISL
jgi:hypothetical protein